MSTVVVSWDYCINTGRIASESRARTVLLGILHRYWCNCSEEEDLNTETGSVGVVALILAELLQESTAKTCKLGLLH